ncbi:MAG TPA: neutral zinc metallopeptidase [Bacteroidia bacterium]|jgi:predicted metalloprotease|nr:neutral zinc metallopeptidase [Bacteroidia bacterium]HMU19845.1 neutral zinc metallopeptidase [Bacteroidia bacterium]
MKWMGRRESDNVEDRRKFSGGKIALGGGLVGIIIIVINLLMGGDPNQLLQQIQQQAATQTTSQEPSAADDEMASFIKVALADNEDIWKKIFRENKLEYREPKLVLFRDATQSGCGNASSAVGPFYCPADEKVYIDLSFFDELKSRFGAQGGDFAIAYVLAHEVGHHVQHLLGTSDKVHDMQNQLSETEANKLSVALELQADFYAGVWANQNQKLNNVLEDGDIEEALSAASAVGDDKIQKKSQGYVVPDAFTHGTSEQRMFWFKKGFQTGKLQEGNTFKELNI